MEDLEERKFRLHSHTDDYQYRIQKAESWIDDLFDEYDKPYIALSGGKDSTVLHHLVVSECGYNNVDVFNFNWGRREVPGIEEHVRQLTSEYGGTLVRRTSEGVQSEEKFRENEHLGTQGLFGWIDRLKDERGWEMGLVGIRAEESAARRDKFTGSPPTHNYGPLPAAAPIHHLTTDDVWAYIVANDLPYHSVYDDQADLYGGIDARSNRLVTVYDHEFDKFGSESISQFVHPSRTAELKEIEQDAPDD